MPHVFVPFQKQKIEMYIRMVVTIVKKYGTIIMVSSLDTLRIVNFSRLMLPSTVGVLSTGNCKGYGAAELFVCFFESNETIGDYTFKM